MSRSLVSLKNTVGAEAASMNLIMGDAFKNGVIPSKNGWLVSNAYIKNRSWQGSYSIGSDGQGAIDATWEPAALGSGRQISSFEYKWQETSSQTGHMINLYDASGNKVMGSGTENPQWMISDGFGGRSQIYTGDGYDRWIYYRFDFDWSQGEYSFHLEDLSSGTVREGWRNLDSSTEVASIDFSGGSTDDSANHCFFDDLRIGSQAGLLDFKPSSLGSPDIYTSTGDPVVDKNDLDCASSYEARMQFGVVNHPAFDQIKNDPSNFEWQATGSASLGTGNYAWNATFIMNDGSGTVEAKLVDGYNNGMPGYGTWLATSVNANCSGV